MGAQCPLFLMRVFRFFHDNKNDVSVITDSFDVEEYARKYAKALNTPNKRYIEAKEKALIRALISQGLLPEENAVGIGLELKEGQERGRAQYAESVGSQGKRDIDYILANDPFLTETFHPLPVDELAISQDPNHTGGRKFDGGKLQYGLLPPLSLQDVVKVLTFGAQKYEIDNWKRVPDAKRRYFDAANRHIWAYKAGELNDPETGVNHLAHAICCLMFINDLDNTGD